MKEAGKRQQMARLDASIVMTTQATQQCGGLITIVMAYKMVQIQNGIVARDC